MPKTPSPRLPQVADNEHQNPGGPANGGGQEKFCCPREEAQAQDHVTEGDRSPGKRTRVEPAGVEATTYPSGQKRQSEDVDERGMGSAKRIRQRGTMPDGEVTKTSRFFQSLRQ